MMSCFCLLAISAITLCIYKLYRLGKGEVMKVIMKKMIMKMKMTIELRLVCMIRGGKVG